MNSLYDELAWRGFLNQHTFKDPKEINQPRIFYWGVDPSADSMQIGNLAPAMMIRHFINHGHKAILLVGGATGMIGDPDGKKQERDLKTLDEIAKNKSAIAAQYKTIFSGQDFEVVDNYDWFKNVNYLDFLRDVGKHAPMTQMLDREFVQNRIGEDGDGISYAEFSYSLIQGYDFLHLFRQKGASLQVGGSDQWGNMISGVQLIRRIAGGEAHIWSTPLIINKQTGVKFGKSEGGAIWLDPKKTSPYKFYQFWLNVDDETAEDLIKVYTLLPQAEVMSLIEQHREKPFERLLQKKLALEVTTIVHGHERADSVVRATNLLFSKTEYDAITQEDGDVLADEMPVVSGSQALTDILTQSNLASSNAEAKRLIEAGSISVNGQKMITNEVIQANSLLKKGKNSFVLIR